LALCLPVSLQKLITNILALWMICGGSTDGCHFCILIFYVVVGYLWEELSVKRSRTNCTVETSALIGVVLTPLPVVCASKVREERRYEKINLLLNCSEYMCRHINTQWRCLSDNSPSLCWEYC
jgi:hypothetical protein